MDKSKIADTEIEVAKWMNKKGYDRRASKDIAPIIVEYLREFKLLDLPVVSEAKRKLPHPHVVWRKAAEENAIDFEIWFNKVCCNSH